MKVCFVHDWLVTYRGGEKVLQSLGKIFPEAPIYTLFYDQKKMRQHFKEKQIITSESLKYAQVLRKMLLPLYPSIIESFNLNNYDVVISSSSAVAKGVIPKPGALHICYIHSPMRYIWDQKDQYFSSLKKIPLVNLMIEHLLSNLRIWDTTSSNRVDYFIANSNFVAKRVKSYYRREAEVIHPPVNVEYFSDFQGKTLKKDYLLVAGAFVPYKRFDLAIAAAIKTNQPLIVAGFGPMEKKLKNQASGHKNIQFISSPDEKRWLSLLREAKALVFPGLEDFGMVPIEAMASGTPVIALKDGGALDYIVEGTTGVFFEEETADSLVKAINLLDTITFEVETLKNFASKFSQSVFINKMNTFLMEHCKAHNIG